MAAHLTAPAVSGTPTEISRQLARFGIYIYEGYPAVQKGASNPECVIDKFSKKRAKNGVLIFKKFKNSNNPYPPSTKRGLVATLT